MNPNGCLRAAVLLFFKDVIEGGIEMEMDHSIWQEDFDQ
jgi:hypothetical protein